jgi:hypothetical protein
MIDSGPPKDDPGLVRLNELRNKSKDGRKSKNGLTPEEVKEYRSLVHELVAEQVEQAKAAPRPALMVADSNSFRAWPLREMAKEEGVDENDPLLLWALEAQEKADWRTNPASWSEMETAVWAFIEAHFDVKGPSSLEEDPPEGPWLLHPDSFLARARKAGIDENDPTLLRAIKALKAWRSGKKWRSGTTAPEKMDAAFQELNAALDAFREAHKKK